MGQPALPNIALRVAPPGEPVPRDSAIRPARTEADDKEIAKYCASPSARGPNTKIIGSAPYVGRNDPEVRRLQVDGSHADEVGRTNAFAGTPAEVVDKLGAHTTAGADRAWQSSLTSSV